MNKRLEIKEIEKIAKALGDPYRLRIMEAINKQQECMQCSVIVDMFELAQSTVSHHIKQLVDADLLIAAKDGRNARYVVNKDIFSAYINFLSQFSQ